jgi:hypothetical protein
MFFCQNQIQNREMVALMSSFNVSPESFIKDWQIFT